MSSTGEADELVAEGDRLLAQRDVAGATRAFEQAVQRHASHVPAWIGLGAALDRAGRWAEAAAAFERALELDPACGRAANDLGNALWALRREEAALAAYRRATDIAPDSAEAHTNLGHLAQTLGDLETAAVSYARALELDPHLPATCYLAATAELALGRCEAALALCERCLRIEHYAPDALALRAIVLNELGRSEECRRLLDFRHLVRCRKLPAPPGYVSLRRFNRDLERYVLEESTLTPDPFGASTRGGRHSDDLLGAPQGPAQVLKQLLHTAFSEYAASLPVVPGHPFLGASVDRVRLVAQANVLANGGRLVPHVHPHAWVSGAYYVRVPPEISVRDKRRRGWLRFGATPDEIRPSLPLPTFDLCPEEGLLVLFPSYLYHGTLPFAGKTHRMSLGIDVIRA